MNEHDIVALTRAFPDFGLNAGVLGTIVHVHNGGGFMVEFNETEDGPIESFPADALRPATEAELNNRRARNVAAE